MRTLLRIIAALFQLSLSTAFFRPAYSLLPRQVRYASAGFIAVAVLYLVASMFRHGYVGGAPIPALLYGQLFYLGFVMLIAGSFRARELTLYLASSAGVDILVSIVGILGLVNIDNETVRGVALAWEYGAAFYAIVRMHRLESQTA